MTDVGIMKIAVPSTESMKFNERILDPGTPIVYKYQQNSHFFLALVQEYGPYFISITNGHITKTIEVEEITTKSCKIVPLIDNWKEEIDPLVVECRVFDLTKLPVGSVFVDQDGVSFLVNEVNPFCLTLATSDNSLVTIYSEVFFALDAEEILDCYLILPPLIVEAMVKQASAYKETM